MQALRVVVVGRVVALRADVAVVPGRQRPRQVGDATRCDPVDATDDDPRRLTGGHHARWQELLDGRDAAGLVAFAATPEALLFPPGLIYRLGHDLEARGHPAARLDLLRAAVARYPQDVWLHYDLMWAFSIALGLLAAVLHWPIVEKPVERGPIVAVPA